MIIKSTNWKKARLLFCLLLLGCAVHGLILVNDGVYWDGWPIAINGEAGNLEFITSWFDQAGVLDRGLIHRALWSTHDPIFFYRVTAFLGLVGVCLLIFLVGSLTGFLTRFEAALLGAVAMTFPTFRVGFAIILLPYIVWLDVFFLASALLFTMVRKKGLPVLILRLSALGLFFWSFELASLLVFYWGIIGLLFIRIGVIVLEPFRLPRLSFRKALGFADFLLLPFIYWVLKNLLAPTYGYYATYNSFISNPLRLFSVTNQFLAAGVVEQVLEILGTFRSSPLPMLIIMAVVLSLFWWKKDRYGDWGPGTDGLLTGGVGGIFVAAGILFVLAITPYILVGKGPNVGGWSTRNSILVSLPVGLFVLGLLRRYFRSENGGLSRGGVVLITILISGSSVVMVRNYLLWQARWVHDRAAMVTLAEQPHAQKYRVFWVDDDFPPVGGEPYRDYEWSSILWKIWGDQSRVGYDLRKYNPGVVEATGLLSRVSAPNLGSTRLKGPVALLRIKRGRLGRRSALEICGRYWVRRWQGEPQLTRFLKKVVRIEVTPTPDSASVFRLPAGCEGR